MNQCKSCRFAGAVHNAPGQVHCIHPAMVPHKMDSLLKAQAGRGRREYRDIATGVLQVRIDPAAIKRGTFAFPGTVAKGIDPKFVECHLPLGSTAPFTEADAAALIGMGFPVHLTEEEE